MQETITLTSGKQVTLRRPSFTEQARIAALVRRLDRMKPESDKYIDTLVAIQVEGLLAVVAKPEVTRENLEDVFTGDEGQEILIKAQEWTEGLRATLDPSSETPPPS